MFQDIVQLNVSTVLHHDIYIYMYYIVSFTPFWIFFQIDIF